MDDKRKLREVVLRLSHNSNSDVRVIAAQTSNRIPCLSGKELLSWISRERCVEVRCYLYLALARSNRSMAIKFLKEKESGGLILEQVYVNAGLTIATRSRGRLLKVLGYLFSRDSEVSETAASLARSLTDERDRVTNEFISVLERDAKMERREA